jgi:poly(A) polymerase
MTEMRVEGNDSPKRAPMALRDAACAVADGLVRAGYEAYFAGGCVRDRLLGREVNDYDIATSARPDEVKAVYPKARGVGEAFGVMLVRHGGHTFEVATFREDGPYHDGRRPSEVTYSTARRDAERRDFTINGLFEVPHTGEITDFVGGRDDLAAKLVRAVGDPEARIREDRLRMLRATRFAARYGFAIEPRTAEAIAAHAGELASVSAERVGEEVREMLAHPNRAHAADLIEAARLDHAVFGSSVLRHGRRLDALGAGVPTGGWTTALAAWWLDRVCDAPSVEGHASESIQERHRADIERATEGVRRRLVLSNDETDAFRWALTLRLEAPIGLAHESRALRARIIARPGFDAALALIGAEQPELAARLRARADAELPARTLPAPFLDGAALIAAGYRPSPDFKRWLALALDAQIEGQIASTEDALQLIRTVDGSGSRGGLSG